MEGMISSAAAALAESPVTPVDTGAHGSNSKRQFSPILAAPAILTNKPSSSTETGRIKQEHLPVVVKTEFIENDVDDGIEVFRFDRNSLKLRCEKVSPRQIKRENVATETAKISSAKIDMKVSNVTLKSVVKREVLSSDGSDSDSASSSSSSSSSSNSSSSCSSRSSSLSRSSSPSSSSSNSTKINESSNSSSKENPSSVKDEDSCSTSSVSDSSDSSSESDASDFEDQLTKKVLLTVDGKPAKLQKQGKNVPLDKKDKPIQQRVFADAEVNLSNVQRITGEEENVLEEQVDTDTIMEERGRQRKNGRWGDYVGARKSSRIAPKALSGNKNAEAQLKKRLRSLLKKDASELTDEDRSTIQSFPKIVAEVKKRLHKKEVASERLRESEDPPDLLNQKCAQLASEISRARYLIIYTGAGISTSAKIPDYRGPNGIWTLLQKGEKVTQSLTDFSHSANPTLTHMAIRELWERGICKHVVSQNVDGLHLRSGIPKVALSEVHGNMYIEACVKCGREFVRLFDVTENTKRHQHKTGRYCYHCGHPLRDSIVLFGEKGSLKWPLNWVGAESHAEKADVIICLGSSLKVLRRYPWLWCMSKPPSKRPKLFIVNLQWTPKDQFAHMKINGKCDEVMEKVMARLSVQIPQYSRETDKIFSVATKLHPAEVNTTSSTELSYPSGLPYPDKNKDLRNYIRFEPNFKVPLPYTTNNAKELNNESDGSSAKDSGAEGREAENAKKRQMKGNNSSWLGNAVISKQHKKRKLK